MSSEQTFQVDGVEFRFLGYAGGKEEIYAGTQLLSTATGLFGKTHNFDYNGNRYEVKPRQGMAGVSFKVSKNGVRTDAATESVPPWAMVACGWPIALVAIGGAIGGGLGGAAAAINFSIYKSKLPAPAKVLLNLVCGAAAFVIWYFSAQALLKAIR